jgi:hypothetical protein
MNVLTKPSHRVRRAGAFATLAAAVALLAAAAGAAPARAEFGLHGFDATFTNEDGSPSTQAGSHPFAITTQFALNYSEPEPFKQLVDGELKDLSVQQPAGLVGDATAMPKCSSAGFTEFPQLEHFSISNCPNDTVLGVNATKFAAGLFLWSAGPVYNLEPPPGVAVRLGIRALIVPVTIDITLKQGGDYNVVASLINTPQTLPVFGTELQLWGVPGDPAHDGLRGICGSRLYFIFGEEAPEFEPEGSCPGGPEKPFLTLPGACMGPQATDWEVDSWQEPGAFLSGSVLSHDNAEPPNPIGFDGCDKPGFHPRTESKPTSDSASTGTGLDFDIDFNQEGLVSAHGIAQSTIKKAEITLPKGVTLDPSLAEGIGVCSEADLGNEKIDTAPGEGCPNGSKIGTVEVQTPLLEGTIGGSVYLAEPYQNPSGSQIAFYIVLKDPRNGLLVKLPAKVEPDPNTGQLITTVDDVPQLPFSHFHFHFREGQRAPLITPPSCGSYQTEAKLSPWARPTEPVTATSTFEITRGVNGGPCPSGAPFHPGFEAGTASNQAGSYSPFLMRLTRNDGEQDLSRFSAVLPPGVLGRLAGVSQCPDAAIAAAKAKTGLQERAAPSCPPNSTLGYTFAAAGVGSALTYVPGSLYLAGPYHGDPLSVVAITPAVAGPFDVGTVVVREALTLDANTAEVQVDGSASDPIPHILKGIPLNLRELRVNVARTGFTLNATSCQPSATLATLWGAGTALAPSGETPVGLGARYQAAGCAALGFKPKLGIKLRGGTHRGAHPALRAVVTPKSGNANFSEAVVTLPSSAFLDQGHIRTVCTRVQFAAAGGNGAGCPAAAQYGYARAWTPLLANPLQGPVYLRSSNHKLPDLVVALHGIVDLNLAARIDSVKLGKGGSGIRTTFSGIPDAPVSRFILDMQGGKKGLVQNSTNLCKGKHRARSNLTAQNGKFDQTKPVVRATKCKKGKKR